MKLAVVADDFTGANDVALQIRKYGLEVASLWDENFLADSQVSVVSSESRTLQPDAAKKRVEDIFLNLKDRGFEKFYKKIDSTLRGNLREELDGILAHLDRSEKLIVVPSFPKTGRTVKNCRHYVNGVPLHLSEFSSDPLHPIKTNDLMELFKIGKCISIENVRCGLLEKLSTAPEQVIILDAETDSDLILISEVLVKLGLDRYVVGSAGIMEHLMRAWGYRRERVLIVSGSCNDKNIEQIDYFLSHNRDNLNLMDINFENRSENSIEAFENERDIVLRSISEKPEMYSLIEKGYHPVELGDYMGKLASEITIKYQIKKIMISGGETTLKVLKNLEVSGLKVQKEVEPGIAFCTSLDGKYEIITKPGGFGSLEIFNKCRSRF